MAGGILRSMGAFRRRRRDSGATPQVRSPSASSAPVIDTRTNTLIGVPIAIAGNPTVPVILSPDGTRALQTTSGPSGQTTRVTVIDTANGTDINAVDLTGSIGLLRVTPDGNHVFAETMGPTGVTVTVLDGRTGAVTGAPHQISGFPIGEPVFVGTRACKTTISSSEGSSTTTVTEFDSVASSILGSITFDGVADGGVVISSDGAIAAQVTHDPFAATVTTVTLFDPDTGEVVGAPIPLEGNHDPYFPALFSHGGDRLSIATGSDGIHAGLVVIDTERGRRSLRQ